MYLRSPVILLPAALLAVLVAFLPGCGGEDPVAGDRPQLVLATATIAGSGTTAMAPPEPLAARVEFGVQSDPPDYSEGNYPRPLLFGDHVMTSDDVGAVRERDVRG